MNFTPEECRIIYFAIKHYQVHGASFRGGEQKVCEEILSKTFGSIYTQRREQPT
jgi:hypothetical protein